MISEKIASAAVRLARRHSKSGKYRLFLVKSQFGGYFFRVNMSDDLMPTMQRFYKVCLKEARVRLTARNREVVQYALARAEEIYDSTLEGSVSEKLYLYGKRDRYGRDEKGRWAFVKFELIGEG